MRAVFVVFCSRVRRRLIRVARKTWLSALGQVFLMWMFYTPTGVQVPSLKYLRHCPRSLTASKQRPGVTPFPLFWSCVGPSMITACFWLFLTQFVCFSPSLWPFLYQIFSSLVFFIFLFVLFRNHLCLCCNISYGPFMLDPCFCVLLLLLLF